MSHATGSGGLTMFPAHAVSATAAQVASGGTAVVTSAVSGLATGGAVAGIIAAGAAVVAVFLTIAATNRKNALDYASEIEKAEARGVAEQKQWTDRESERAVRAERDAEYWRGLAMSSDRTGGRQREGRD